MHATMRRLAKGVVQIALLGGIVGSTAMPAHAAYYSIANWQGKPHVLNQIPNETVEGYGDASIVGVVTNFQTDNPAFSCLNGSTLNVFTAPAEHGSDLVVHNGLQGPQCTYGTWIIGAELFYEATYLGVRWSLAWHANVTVEGLLDHVQLPLQATNFQTNDPRYSCLNGSSLNTWLAPVEFGASIVVHNGFQGSQCTYGTWTFPNLV